MKRSCLAVILSLSVICACAQGNRSKRPTVYEQTDFVRNELKLDHKQFDKLYKAYEKYNKAVFGDDESAGQFGNPPQGGRPGGGPGGRPGGGGGMRAGGGPGGAPGGAPGGGPGGMGQGEGPGMNRPPRDAAAPSAADLEKLEKTKAKQEEKLVKSVKKIFKKDEPLFQRWQEIRAKQLQQLFPQPPRAPRPAEDVPENAK